MGDFRIDVISDTVCPWCYVGKRQLDLALKQRDDLNANIHWQPFQLAPEVPADGLDRETYWREKFGDDGRIQEMTARLAAVGQTLGIEFDFSAIKVQPNTLASHKLLHWQAGSPHQHALKESILQAFFADGKDIGDADVLCALATELGLDESEARAALASETATREVTQLLDQARSLGVTGVPTFIFNQRIAVSGAQPPAQLLNAIDESLQELPTEQPK